MPRIKKDEVPLSDQKKLARCKGCKYLVVIGATPICDYLMMVGTRRPCKATECKTKGVYKKKRKRKKDGQEAERP